MASHRGNGIPLRLVFLVVLSLRLDGGGAVARHRRSGGFAAGVCAAKGQDRRAVVVAVNGRPEQRIIARLSSALLHFVAFRPCHEKFCAVQC